MTTSGHAGTQPEAHLERGREAFVAALRAGDVEAAATSYADDATLVVPAGDVLHGRPAIEGFWRTGVQLGIEDIALAVLEVKVRGDIAIEVGEYALHQSGEDGRRQISGGRYLVVHRLGLDGVWRRAAEMFNPSL
jgi:uncharacterized protein (TIGR02246 family)